MNERHKAYLDELKARHQRDRDELRAALAGRRPWLLFELRRRQVSVEQETAVIFETLERGR